VSLADLRALEERYLMPTYRKAPVEFVRGEGAYLWDADGKRYLDFLAGISVTSVGHCHPKVVEAIREQAGRLMHVTSLYYTDLPLRLAERLSQSSLGGKVFFTNSGTEANECAIKLVRKHARGRGVEDPEIVVLEEAFHGRTLGALAATPQPAKQEPFAPLPPGFVVVPRDDAEAVAGAVGEQTAAVFIEPIQGECGIHPTSEDVLVAAREACDQAGALLVFDEIQSGMGRTGSLWAYEQTAVRPDVMTTAKALGGGLPIGACVTSPEYGDVLEAGEHGSTFAGGPVVAAAALAAFDVIDDPDLLRRVRELGARLASGLETLDGITEVRQRGLMVGVDLQGDAPQAALDLLEEGLVVNATGPSTIRFEPPLMIGEQEVDEALGILGRVMGTRSSRGTGDAPSGPAELRQHNDELWNAGDMRALKERYAPDVVMTHPEGWPEPGPSVGREAVFRQFELLREGWERDRVEPREIAAAGEWVVDEVRWVAQGKESGAGAEMVVHRAIRVRNGRIVEQHFCWERQDALRAAGLTE
jgi:acetylornithine/N-succinyldiaminopimelate aminotransferase